MAATMLAAHAKRSCALLTAFALTVPTLVILLAGGAGAPAVWVRNAMAAFRQGKALVCNVSVLRLPKLHGVRCA